MLIAAECEQRNGLHVNADHLLVETPRPADAASGVAGDVVITDLHNWAMPFIRYVNGDLATPSSRTCACGRGLPLLERMRRAQARCDPHARRADPAGRVLSAHAERRARPGALPGGAALAPDTLDISVVRGEGFEAGGLDYARTEIRKVLGDALEVRFPPRRGITDGSQR